MAVCNDSLTSVGAAAYSARWNCRQRLAAVSLLFCQLAQVAL